MIYTPYGAISSNDPFSTGYSDPGAVQKRNAIKDQFYEFSHGNPYQFVATGLYALSPVTGGITYVPATIMTSAAALSSLEQRKRNGWTADNATNLATDAIDLMTGQLSLGLTYRTAEEARNMFNAAITKEVFEQAIQSVVAGAAEWTAKADEKKKKSKQGNGE